MEGSRLELTARAAGRLGAAVSAGILAAMAVVVYGGSARPAHAEEPRIVIKTGGKLPVPPSAALGVIATDPVLQQVLSQDLEVAGRLAGASATSEVTLTVTLTHRALEPGMALSEVAPGNGAAVALLEKAGVKPLQLPEQKAQDDSDNDNGSDDDDNNAAEGNSGVKNDVDSYEQQGHVAHQQMPMGGAMPPLPMTGWPVPPATAQQRSAIPPYMQTYPQGAGNSLEKARHEHEASDVYDTIFIARATAGDPSAELTVVAVAHPGFDAHEVRKLIAEEIANSVLH
jgi:hypothetical protein